MTDVEKAEVDKKWAEAKKEIEEKIGADNKDDWERFVHEFEVSLSILSRKKTGFSSLLLQSFLFA